MKRALSFLFVGLLAIASGPCAAQAPSKQDLEAAEMVAELIGAPVFAADGAEIGQVSDISFDGELQPRWLRMTTDAKLGLGARNLEFQKGEFTALRGAVVLHLPVEAVEALPAGPPRPQNK
jgi:PRC-barrel domain